MRIQDVGSFKSVQNVSDIGASKEVSSVSTGVQNEIAADVVQEAGQIVQNENNQEGKSIIDDEMLAKAVEQANKSLEVYNRYIERSVHEKTKAIMYIMKDTKTDEVIREFPPKKIQDMIAKMWELAGLFIDEKA